MVIPQLLLATTVEVCGRGWQQVISREVRHARQLPTACFLSSLGAGHNNTHPQQAFWTSGFGLPRLSWTVSAWLQACGLQAALHVCWPDASVVADPQGGPGLEKQPPNKHLQVLRSVVVHHQRFQGCEDCDQETRRLLQREPRRAEASNSWWNTWKN